MPKRKLRVAVLMGGRSAEHEVSLRSADNIIRALDRTRYDVVPMRVSKDGRLTTTDARRIFSRRVDVAFPVLHGTYGEDGTFQGLLRAAGVPYVGPDVLASAVCMDKEITKRLLQQVGIPIAKYKVIERSDRGQVRLAALSKYLGLPLFIKPASLGSSVGVHKVTNDRELSAALADAFQYDHKVLAEQFIKGREIECSVLGNDKPQASLPGEIIPHHAFYSYEAKYEDDDGARLEIPARMTVAMTRRIQEVAVSAFRTLCCQGMARVDFFLTANGKLYVNELNTIPGFTDISMYPKLWEASGISYTELVDRLIQLALERHQTDEKLRTSYV